MTKRITEADGLELVGTDLRARFAAVLRRTDAARLAEVLSGPGIPGDGYTLVAPGFDLSFVLQTGGTWLIQIKENG